MKQRKPHYEISLLVCGEWETLNIRGDTYRLWITSPPKMFPTLKKAQKYIAEHLPNAKYKITLLTPPELVKNSLNGYAWGEEIVEIT